MNLPAQVLPDFQSLFPRSTYSCVFLYLKQVRVGAEASATASEQDPGLAADSDKMPKRSSPSLLSAAHLEAMTECQSYASLPAYKQVRRLPTASSDFSLSDSEDDDEDGTSSVLSSCGSSASEESLLSCASSRAVPDAGDHRELKPQEHINDRYLSGDALSTHADAAIPAHVKRSLSQMPYPVDPGQLAQLNVPTTNDLDEALRSNGLLAYVPSTDIGLQKPAQHLVSFTEVLACTSMNILYVNLTSYLPILRPGERSECGFFGAGEACRYNIAHRTVLGVFWWRSLLGRYAAGKLPLLHVQSAWLQLCSCAIWHPPPSTTWLPWLV